jgi:hypothetical protein
LVHYLVRVTLITSHLSKAKSLAKKSEQKIAGLKDDVRNDMKKLKIKNWTNCIQDRNNWKFYVEKAKIFKY